MTKAALSIALAGVHAMLVALAQAHGVAPHWRAEITRLAVLTNELQRELEE